MKRRPAKAPKSLREWEDKDPLQHIPPMYDGAHVRTTLTDTEVMKSKPSKNPDTSSAFLSPFFANARASRYITTLW